jgi:hypothetical protein
MGAVGGMIEIPLTKGYVALIDDEDARLSEFKWFADVRPTVVYAARNARHSEIRAGSPPIIRLHRMVTPCPEGYEIDHINQDGLDCRRSNLRVVTKSQNQRNKKTPRCNTSGYRGACRTADGKKWRAQLGSKHLGTFETAEEAAQAFDRAVLERDGDFARLNFPGEAQLAA